MIYLHLIFNDKKKISMCIKQVGLAGVVYEYKTFTYHTVTKSKITELYLQVVEAI